MRYNKYMNTTIEKSLDFIKKSRSRLGKNKYKMALILALTFYLYPKAVLRVNSTKVSLIQNFADSTWNWLDSLYETRSKETNSILWLITGSISKEELAALQVSYGYDKDLVNLDSFTHDDFDPAFYEAIRYIQRKYHSPLIKFHKSIFADILDSTIADARWHYNPLINTIHIFNLQWAKINFNCNIDDYNEDTYVKTWMSDIRYYLRNVWLAELAHVKQHKQQWGYFYIRALVEWGRWKLGEYPYTTYSDTYNWPWTIEYEAHNIFEKQIAKELLDQYELYAQKNNTGKQKYQLAMNFGGAFRSYEDPHKAVSYMHASASLWYKEAYYMLGILYTSGWTDAWVAKDALRWENYYKRGEELGSIECAYELAQYYQSIGKKQQAITLFHKCLEGGYYAQSAKSAIETMKKDDIQDQ